jgi:prophage regulatory protein
MNEHVQRPPRTILRLRQVIGRTGLSRSTIYERIQSRTFPAQIRLGARAVGWLESDVEAWIGERLNASRANEDRKVAVSRR